MCGLCVVLNNLSEQFRECLLHAKNCARQAAAETNPELKAGFLGLERSWLLLARGYEFTDQADRLSDEGKRKAHGDARSL